MESLVLKLVTFSATPQFFNSRKSGNPLNRIHRRRTVRFPLSRFPLLICAKGSLFQDFEEYAKPSRLLQAMEVKFPKHSWVERIFTPSKEEKVAQSLYKVDISTSSQYGSSLSDLNSGVLLCLIDENGDSILQRIPSSLMQGHSTEKGSEFADETLHFQRGSIDEFTFLGPKLGTIEAVWISLESGQWRLGKLSIAVISKRHPPLLENPESKDSQYDGLIYNFQFDDILVGEGSSNSMVELRPYRVTELLGSNITNLLTRSSTLVNGVEVSSEESMKEYEELKLSLLLYDAILIIIGTSIASFVVGENGAFAFLVGGMGGFVYLLLVQRSVDGLLEAESKSGDKLIGGYNKGGPIWFVGLGIGLGILMIGRYYYREEGGMDFGLVLSGKEVVFGMMGFLACKLAVVLAAFKPLGMSREKKVEASRKE